ncbi:GTP cyclohydrolase II [Moraxella equi]|uniref:GTP cyclohydrolase-2 n=1 Tax=Moraxella equi TaxID=60442 RepID=A0ABX3NIP8_9GAMM|nr:GTP cyclohydrolase II [Moraxella equi]
MLYQFISKANLPTVHGDFIIHAFENEHGQEHVLLSVGLPSTDPDKIPLIRIHSECLTGDAFGSLKCDCGPQLNTAMQMIQAHGSGAILYLRQEGRGIGLVNKIRAYALQDQGHDTLDANLMLGLPADARTYEMCEIMLKHVGITQAKLLTNNPNKLAYLQELGIDVVERVPLLVGVNQFNAEYLAIKGARMGHFIPAKVDISPKI